MKNTKLTLSLWVILTVFTFRLSASESIQIGNGWSFNYVIIGDNVTLTEVVTSGDEKLVIPTTIEINSESYTISALKNGLFSGNESLKKITISSALTSLNAEISTEIPDSYPFTDNPITLTTPVVDTDIWRINAIINTGGESFNQWGTALFASGDVPNLDHYPGGFQFWLNNGTSNNNGRILWKYGNNTSSYLFGEDITIMPGGTNDMAISLSYDGAGNYIAILETEGKKEKKTVALPIEFAGFTQLSSAIRETGSFTQLEISTFSFPSTAGSLSGANNLTYISVNPGNPVYSSSNGSLYDSEENVLIDLSEFNTGEQEPLPVGDGWEFNYEVFGNELILTEVVTSGNESLVIPASVTIDGTNYTIGSLKNDLFEGNETLKRLSVPATITSMAVTINSEEITTKPAIDVPVTLPVPVVPEDIWTVKAVMNTGGEYFNEWGTALLATGNVPSLDDYVGGFQFWLNNGTAGGDNSSGTLVYKYGAGATKYIFSEEIKVQAGSTEDISINLAYRNSQYVATVSSGGITESYSIETTPCTGFTQLSTALPAAGTFSTLEISKFIYEEKAGSLANTPNLQFILIDPENPVYSSINGSLYDKSGENVLLDLSEYNTTVETVLQLNNGWSFNCMAIGNNLTLTAVLTSGNEVLNLPASAEIDGVSYTIVALKDGLFNENTVLSELILPASIVSLGTTLSTETPAIKPAIDAPITLNIPLFATDIWTITAKINTGGAYFNEWGTALLASSNLPSLDDYSGGFQFWLNNGTAAGDNSKGTLVYKYGAGATKYTFSDAIKVPAGSIEDITITLSYDNGEYTAVVSAEDQTEKFSVIPEQPFAGLAQLSTALPATGEFLQLDITKVDYAKTVGSISGAPNLVYIHVNEENPVYISSRGSLYSAEDGELLLDLSAYGIIEDEPLVLDNGWAFNYLAVGSKLTLTEVITSGQENLALPASVQIGEESYSIASLEADLFKENATIKTIEIPATLTSLGTSISTENPTYKPFADAPITLDQAILATDTWIVNAVVNTAGEYYNQWGTAILATGEVPNLDDYVGGFQFWLNNGTAGGENSSGSVVYKYGAGATKYVFPDDIKIVAGSMKDLGFTLSYSDSEYTAIIKGSGKVDKYSITTTPCLGFTQLSSALTGDATYDKLEISRLNFSDGAGSLGSIPNLRSISVDSDNPVYSSKNGSLYDKSGEKLLVDLGVTGVDLIGDDIKVYANNGKIIIEGLKVNDICKVYTTSGVEINYQSATLPQGVYIVLINDNTYKIRL